MAENNLVLVKLIPVIFRSRCAGISPGSVNRRTHVHSAPGKCGGTAQVYLSLIRPVLEYGHILLVGCNEEQSASMERVQKRALSIITCGGRRAVPNLPTLKERRESAAVNLFKAMLNPDHPLHDLVPPVRATATGRQLRNSNTFTLFA
ncbi:hypothetical protein Bbelb_369240 [Branchiostoma belcheri]|nr:hypothetical protein Bbelb_369240 [Branchiostoma belcheri]